MKLSLRRVGHYNLAWHGAGTLLVLVFLVGAYWLHQRSLPTRTISFHHTLFSKSEDNINATLTYQKSQWHSVTKKPDNAPDTGCDFIQSSNSNLTIGVGTECVVPQEYTYTSGLGLNKNCPDGETVHSPCITESKTIKTLQIALPGHQFTSYEPYSNAQPVELTVHRQSTDSGKIWRYWLTLEEITVEFPNGGSNGASSVESYISQPEVAKAISVLETMKTK